MCLFQLADKKMCVYKEDTMLARDYAFLKIMKITF